MQGYGGQGYGGQQARGNAAYGGPPPHAPGSIRHAYPLTSTSTGFFPALFLNVRTLPYAFVRFFLHLVHAVVGLLFIGGTIALAAFVGSKVHPAAGLGVLLAGIVLYGAVWGWWFRYLLYAVKCGHIACLTDLVTRGKIGDGHEGMLSYGKHTVRDRLGDIAQVYVMQGMVRALVLEVTMGLGLVGDLMPFDVGFITTFARSLIRAGTRYLDETLFAYSLLRRNEPLWDVCSEGMGYYFQNVREIAKTSVWVVIVNTVLLVVMWIGLGVLFGVVLYPVLHSLAVAHVGDLYDPSAGGAAPNDTAAGLAIGGAILGSFLLTALIIHSLEQSFLRPIYLTMVMTKFLVTIQSQPLDPRFQSFLGSSRATSLRNVTSQIDAKRLTRA